MLAAARNLGALLCDGIGDAVMVRGETDPGQSLRLAYNILQAAGTRIIKTDYVACPSCGRTLFNLQSTTQRIRAATGHLKGVRIAVMGCIVNGPGEMADADFGYVGGAPRKINLYVRKTPVRFNIPEDEAVDHLIDLIREHGKWVDAPPTPQPLTFDPMADTDTLTRTREETALDVPWNVVVHDDPVNLMGYVTWVFMKVFGYDEKKAAILMMQVHQQGRSIVWTGQREKAEFYVQQLQSHQLKTSLEKAA